MTDEGTLLKALLRQRHLQEHQAFCREYDKTARTIDPKLQGQYPSKATFYRWLSGDLRKLPFPGHCRVLETMLPGWSAQELFKPWAGDALPRPTAVTAEASAVEARIEAATREKYADLAGVFVSRSELTHVLPPAELFRGATDIRAVGLSLNGLCQDFGDRRLRQLVEAGCTVRCLFLDPRGEAIARREQEENHAPGHLSALTAVNMQVMGRLRAQLPEETRGQVDVRTYDEAVRFNVTIVNGRTCVAQPYLPDTRGTDSPTFLVERQEQAGLFAIFEQVFDALWDRSKPVG